MPAPTASASASTEDGVPPGLVIERSDRSATGFKGVTRHEKKGPFFVQFRQPDGVVVRWSAPYATALEAAVAMAQHKLTKEWAELEARASSDERMLTGAYRRQGGAPYGIDTRGSPNQMGSPAAAEKTASPAVDAPHAAIKSEKQKMATEEGEEAEGEEAEGEGEGDGEGEGESEEEPALCGLQGCCLPAYHKGICVIPAPEKRTRSSPAAVSSPGTSSPKAPPSGSSGGSRACAN